MPNSARGTRSRSAPRSKSRSNSKSRSKASSDTNLEADSPPLPDPVVYRVGMSDPASHEFEIEIHVPAHADRPAVEMAFPAWAPGSYMIRDFARHVYQLKVSDPDGRALEPTRLDKQRWRVDSGGRAFVVRYRVFAFEATVRTSFLDDSHAYWNGTSLFFLIDGESARPCRLDIVAPTGWRISTALPPTTSPSARGGDPRGRRGARPIQSFWAANFDDLVDAPVEIGTHEWHSFRVDGCEFELALYGRTNADSNRLLEILRQVVTATGKIFGGFPFARYLFIVHALPVASGGLEHRASVTMDIAGLSFDEEPGYVRFADLAAHEFFHAWNVKRLHDPVLGPFDYGRECYTRLLWFHEGFTDYLANVIILRSGVIDTEAFWRWINTDWPRYANRPGRRETPLSELSFEAWIKQYKPADNHINRAVSYYEKGLWVGMALDLELRLATAGRRGLPELFAHLWMKAGRREATVTETDVRAAARAVGGRSFDGFFERYIHGTDDVPLPRLWRRSGLEVRLLRPWDAATGETDVTRRTRARSWIGVSVQGLGHPGGSERAIIKNVLPDSPAARAGLTFGDELVAVNGDRVTAASVGRRLTDHAPGARTVITYFRRERLRTASVTIGTSPERKLDLKPARSASRAASAIRRGWLGVVPATRKP